MVHREKEQLEKELMKSFQAVNAGQAVVPPETEESKKYLFSSLSLKTACI